MIVFGFRHHGHSKRDCPACRKHPLSCLPLASGRIGSCEEADAIDREANGIDALGRVTAALATVYSQPAPRPRAGFPAIRPESGTRARKAGRPQPGRAGTAGHRPARSFHDPPRPWAISPSHEARLMTLPHPDEVQSARATIVLEAIGGVRSSAKPRSD